MTTDFDRRTEGERERALMARVRGGTLGRAELAGALPDFPLKIQIQTFSPCNAACTMCPWPATKDTLPQGRMEEEVFELLVDQLAGRGVERTSLFLMNEPLLDKRLEAFTAHLKARVPETTALIYTNGSLLTAKRARALAEAGMDEVNVSVVGFDAASYAAIMRDISFDAVMANLAAVAAARRAGDLGAMEVRVIGLEFPEALCGIEEFRRKVDLELFLKPVTNRAGLIDVDAFDAPPFSKEDEGRRFLACQRPFVKAYVLYNGDVVLCNCDWERTTIVGNLRERPLADIWRGEKLTTIRGWHLDAAPPEKSICGRCDYPYHTTCA